jgi:rare lipoprotein A
MRILRALPVAVGLTLAALATTPASAESGYTFEGRSEYRDSISANSYRRSNLGAMDVRRPQRAERAERQERPRSRKARIRDDSDRETRRTARNGRRGTRVASLGNDIGASFGGGGGSHGIASYYWQPQRVASGGWFNPNAMTAAHKTLPFGTRVRVTHLGNGRSVVVKINDRGPYIRGRIIDLSKAAAGVIGMQGQGIARIRMDVLGR